LRTWAKGFLTPEREIKLHFQFDPHPAARWIFSKHHRSQVETIEHELRHLPTEGWHDFRDGNRTDVMFERVVEVPWVLSRYGGESRVLDIGTAFGYSLYVRHLQRMGIPQLHGLDLRARRLKGIQMVRGDVTSLPYRDSTFDLILCVSTIEHIGLNVARYGVAAPVQKESGDAIALKEMRRVLRPDGRILITVPFGKREVTDWYRQYDLSSWDLLLQAAGARKVEQELFEYRSNAWWPSDPAHPPTGGYAEDAQAASGLLCATLQ
jgi:SAM-dependent methyltransferase